MTKPQLAIFDLDKTLVRGDSFRSLIFGNLTRHPQLAGILMLRMLRFLNRMSFAEKAHYALSPVLADRPLLDVFLDNLEGRVNASVLEDAQRRLVNTQHVVLISASPHAYVQALAKRLGFSEGFGSDWRDDSYNHLYGDNKLEFAKSRFPPEDYEWIYAISDSQSDAKLLNACKEHYFWKP